MEETQSDVQIVKRGDIEVRILRSQCIGAATCAVYAEKTFGIDESNIAILLEGDWDSFEKVVAAAESCPVFAIEVYKAGTKIYPLT